MNNTSNTLIVLAIIRDSILGYVLTLHSFVESPILPHTLDSDDFHGAPGIFLL